MAVTVIGLHSAELTDGEEPSGQKTYIAQSDTQILGNVIDVLNATGIPVYDETYDPTATGLKVRTKRATAMDEQEGYVWMVTVNYQTPEKTDGQDALDPRDRPWDWSKGPDKRQISTPNSRFDTANYVYPGSDGVENVSLDEGEAIVNTANLPFSDGVVRTISRQVISLTKYINDYSDVGASSWEDLDSYIDSVNSNNSQSILDISYDKWEMLMDSIDTAPHSENGFDVIRITFRIVTDKAYTHVGSFPSQGYKQLKGGKLVDIKDEDAQPSIEPRLLDRDGLAIPVPDPNIKPIYINAGLNEAKDWSGLSLPTSIP
jgi:hypothetical protein